MWKYCSLVLPNFEYCCLKCSCKVGQSISMGLRDSYYNLASPVRVKQNLCTFASCWKLWVSIKSLVLSKCATASSSGLLENYGLKYNQLNCGTWNGGFCDCIGPGGFAGRSGGGLGKFGGRFGGIGRGIVGSGGLSGSWSGGLLGNWFGWFSR